MSDPIVEAQAAAILIRNILRELTTLADQTIEDIRAANDRREKIMSAWREEISKR